MKVLLSVVFLFKRKNPWKILKTELPPFWLLLPLSLLYTTEADVLFWPRFAQAFSIFGGITSVIFPPDPEPQLKWNILGVDYKMKMHKWILQPRGEFFYVGNHPFSIWLIFYFQILVITFLKVGLTCKGFLFEKAAKLLSYCSLPDLCPSES